MHFNILRVGYQIPILDVCIHTLQAHIDQAGSSVYFQSMHIKLNHARVMKKKTLPVTVMNFSKVSFEFSSCFYTSDDEVNYFLSYDSF